METITKVEMLATLDLQIASLQATLDAGLGREKYSRFARGPMKPEVANHFRQAIVRWRAIREIVSTYHEPEKPCAQCRADPEKYEIRPCDHQEKP